MTNRPTGTVTFLFTDIEGSTRLWESRAAWMERAHARQEALLRAAFAAHGGYPYKMIGDAFQVAFASAPDAVAAAIEAQRALAAEPWGEAAIRVRMALHTGETEERGDDYVGPLLNRVARLMSAGHGGQVLLTQTTGELVREALPPGVSLRDLGERRLRDLTRPERIHQLLAPGLEVDFPALKTVDARPNNLPVQLTQFVGREKPMAEVVAALDRAHLVTLTGSGGAGKTRLAVQLGGELLERFTHGVWLVELASLTDGGEIARAVAAALGVEEVAGKPTAETLAEHLAAEERLVILDNCEHLVRAAAELADKLLRASPRSRILATSREPLRIPGEVTYRVPSLAVPDVRPGATREALAASEAVRLFADRASVVSPSFALTDANVVTIAEICRRLDGIPLAIELAAARVASLSVDKLANRLDDRFRLLTRGSRVGLPRQQTLRALIDWSHELLDEPERVLLRRLAAFAGSFDLEAAEAVCAGGEVDESGVLDLLAELVAKSLVVVEPDGERYRLLETIREYALERLRAASEESGVRERHAAYYLALAERTAERVRSGEATSWKVFEPDAENFFTAHAWCDQTEGRQEDGLRLVWALRDYFMGHGLFEQGHRLMLRAVSRPGVARVSLVRCKAMLDVAWFAMWMGSGEGEVFATEGLAIARELGDDRWIARALREVAYFVRRRGDREAARAISQEAVDRARALDDLATLEPALGSMAEVWREEGELDRAEPLYEEAVAVGRRSRGGSTMVLNLLNLAALNVARGTGERAVPSLSEALALCIASGHQTNGQYALDVCTGLAALRGEWTVAARLFGSAETQRVRIGVHRDAMDEAYLLPLLARTRQALGGEAFEAAEKAGRALGYDEALEEARAWIGAVPLGGEADAKVG